MHCRRPVIRDRLGVVVQLLGATGDNAQRTGADQNADHRPDDPAMKSKESAAGQTSGAEPDECAKCDEFSHIDLSKRPTDGDRAVTQPV